ncbi:MAG: diheme cytochrome c-553 [Pseudomonadota bacterium]
MKRNVVATTALISSALLGLAAWFSSREATGAPPSGASTAQRTNGPVASALPAQAANEQQAREARVARGEHLVLTAGCNDCHTPLKMGKTGPEPDMTRMLSGHPENLKLPPPPPTSMPWIASVAATNTAWAGPWGVSFTANLTPDNETGLGAWSKDEFVQAIKTGRHHGRGRPILPPMPIPAYRNFSEEELTAIFFYLGTIPAIKNQVPDPLPPPSQPKHG